MGRVLDDVSQHGSGQRNWKFEMLPVLQAHQRRAGAHVPLRRPCLHGMLSRNRRQVWPGALSTVRVASPSRLDVPAPSKVEVTVPAEDSGHAA